MNVTIQEAFNLFTRKFDQIADILRMLSKRNEETSEVLMQMDARLRSLEQRISQVEEVQVRSFEDRLKQNLMKGIR